MVIAKSHQVTAIASRCRSLAWLFTLVVAAWSALAAPSALAAGPPLVGETWASKVEARSAQLNAEIDPNGNVTSAYFEYTTKAAYETSGFTGAKKVNLNFVGSGEGSLDVAFPLISGLTPDTTYVYRLKATNIAGSAEAPPAPPYPYFITQVLGGGSILLDGRAWEMVSPIDKNGGQVDPPETLAGGGVLQAAGGGGQITYSSAASFEGGAGAPPASQYIASRGSGGWATQNITTPIFSGSYDTDAGGAPYRLFSSDLARGLLLNGKGCRGEATSGCPVANPPLPGTGAPAGYQDYYLRTTASGSFEALLEPGETSLSGQSASEFEVTLAGASPDLTHVVLSSCAKLTASATSGCPGQANLYEWSTGGGALKQVNATPGASLAAQLGAVSEDGARVYFYAGGNLRLRDGATLKQADAGAGGGGTFETASNDGSLAYFSKSGDLYRYAATTNVATKLTSTADVEGVLGAASGGAGLYYLRATGLYRCAGANSAATNGCDSATKIAEDADESNYPPATGTSRVSSDGTKLLFVATTPLQDHLGHTYDNIDTATGEPDSQVYLYDASGPGLSCLSCNPTNGRPIGPSTIPGAISNGSGPTATIAYKPRVLVDGGRRVFFDSEDAISLTDTNSVAGTGEGIADAYEWEAQGEGSCARAGGCLALVSSGRDAAPSTFADASSTGDDAYFLSEDSLVKADPGGRDLYDARIGGGFAEPSEPIACEGDACQVLPPEPTDPTLTTLLAGPGNPPVKYTRYKHRFKKPHGKKPKRCKQRSKAKRRACRHRQEQRSHERRREGGRR
jgi:hypothetical protein